MPATPVRGTQSVVGQMGWVFARPSLTAIEIAWRGLFGIPFLWVCWHEVLEILARFPLEQSGLSSSVLQNPWLAAQQLVSVWQFYAPPVAALLRWLLPLSAAAWIVISAIGRNLVLLRMARAGGDPGLRVRFRPLSMILMQAAWLGLLAATLWGWWRSIQWAAATHITLDAEPDLVGYAMWAIFLSLGFFTAWALVNWFVSIAPLLMLLEDRSAAGALLQSLKLGTEFTGKLVEINLVMGIVKLALIVVAMVISAAPLPFSDQLGGSALHMVWAAATVIYLVAGDYFHVVRLKGFVEFWRVYREKQGAINAVARY
jgi:hypothetical protein